MPIGGAWGGGGSQWPELKRQLTAAEENTFESFTNDAMIGLQNWAASKWLVHSSGPPPISSWSNRCKTETACEWTSCNECLPVWTFAELHYTQGLIHKLLINLHQKKIAHSWSCSLMKLISSYSRFVCLTVHNVHDLIRGVRRHVHR